MTRLARFLARENGFTMLAVVMMTALLALLGVVLIDQVSGESNRAATAVTSDAVYQAAEAGINDYLAKLTDDPQYYDHCVAKGESTRQRQDNGVSVSAMNVTADCDPGGPSAWKAGVKWTYPSGRDHWTAGTGSSTILSGYAYNLMIAPPTATGSAPRDYVSILSTGCKVLDPSATTLRCDPSVRERSIEVHIRRSTPADFQFMMTSMPTSGSNVVCWGSNVYGKMYSAASANGPGNIYVCGATFYGNVMAEGKVIVASGYPNPPNVVSPARIYDQNHPNIRDVVPNPISFSDLQTSLSDIQRAAASNSTSPYGSTDFDDSSASAWRIIFTSDGNMRVWKCTNPYGGKAEQTLPYCNDIKLSASVTLPKTGATGTVSVTVNESTDSFPGSGTMYIGTSPGRVDTVTYTGKSGEYTFTGVKCSTCGTTTQTHNAGETVSIYASGHQPGFNPVYNGPLPANGAVYTGQSAIISWPNPIVNGYTGDGSSILNGRVGVASAANMIIGGNNHSASEAAPSGIGGSDDDVLGLIAQNDFWLANYAPDQLWFRAATISLTGLWGDYKCTYGGSRQTNGPSQMTFVGTSAYFSNSGCMQSGSDGYAVARVYRITDDGTAPSCPPTAPNCQSFDALKFLFPPWFPVIDGMEMTVLFREVPATYMGPDPSS